MKFDGATGDRLWTSGVRPAGSRRQAVNRALAVTVDGDGDVAAAGIFTDARAHRRFGVAKFGGRDGHVVWTLAYEGPRAPRLFTFDQAFAVAADAAGDIVAAGTAGGQFAVLKRTGSTGEDFVGTGD